MTSIALGARSVRLGVASNRAIATLFTLTVFVAASLLFLVQPMVAKGLLPLFGGTPQVWTTSMLFFQAALLGGYALAHLSLSRLGPRRQSRVQLLLLAAALVALPLAGPATASAGDPVVSLLSLLAAGVGLPFLALSTASPVLQRWFSVSGHDRAADPYVLYVASNVGSLLALLAYPFVVEPLLALETQRLLWSGLYVVFLGLTAVCALALFPIGRRRAPDGAPALTPHAPATTAEVARPKSAADAAVDAGVRSRERARWLILAFIPSSLMLGVTTFLTTDIASAPLLWVAPLALYLLSFVVAFSRVSASATRAASVLLPLVASIAAVDMFGAVGLPVALRLPLHLALFTLAAVLCHGRLAASRPPANRLTEFYLVLAVGGVAGGIVNAIAAPMALDIVAEYPLAIGAALAVRYRIEGGARRRWALGAAAVGAFLLLSAFPLALGYPGAWSSPLLVVAMSLPLLIIGLPIPFSVIATGLLMAGMLLTPPPLLSERNFFGLFRVLEAPGEHQLVHGTTLHGTQTWPPDERPAATGYYHTDGPLGDIFEVRPPATAQEVGIIGLGSGGMAAYMQAGQNVTFYEIDPQMAAVAADSRYFTYLSSSEASIEVEVGDGRLLVADEPEGRFDLLFMDAFSSDSVPTHLLTREAFELYVERLAADGILVVHISNRYVDLAPVVSAAARDLGLHAVQRQDRGMPSDDVRVKRQPSRYIVLARTPQQLAGLQELGWTSLPATARPAWTDAFSEIVSLIDWRGDLLR